ncbi:hypothetical protein [Mesorhizobium sp. M0136]|uniref:hypothetical protein n=1 Tax=Mesorhizobium sp. M0136 TaxID=2956890 RepID=UPI00333DF9F9
MSRCQIWTPSYAKIWLRRLITNLGLSALCVTHDQEEAMALADRILLLNGGQIEQDGTPKQIYNKPKSLFAAEFMGASNRLDGVVPPSTATVRKLSPTASILWAAPSRS